MIQQIITFDGGLSTKRDAHLIERNEGIVCENVDLEKGSLTPLPSFIYLDNVAGKYIYPYNWDYQFRFIILFFYTCTFNSSWL